MIKLHLIWSHLYVPVDLWVSRYAQLPSITKNKRGHRQIQHRFKLLVKINYDISDE